MQWKKGVERLGLGCLDRGLAAPRLFYSVYSVLWFGGTQAGVEYDWYLDMEAKCIWIMFYVLLHEVTD